VGKRWVAGVVDCGFAGPERALPGARRFAPCRMNPSEEPFVVEWFGLVVVACVWVNAFLDMVFDAPRDVNHYSKIILAAIPDYPLYYPRETP
jgi:hypothetical protein